MSKKKKTILVICILVIIFALVGVAGEFLTRTEFEGQITDITPTEAGEGIYEYILCVDTLEYTNIGKKYIRITSETNIKNSSGGTLPMEGLEKGDIVTVTLRKKQLEQAVCEVLKVVFQDSGN